MAIRPSLRGVHRAVFRTWAAAWDRRPFLLAVDGVPVAFTSPHGRFYEGVPI
ncbi:hypothetical protein [Glycomyces albidus]|uniref:hypothetical protein n=1 Tax=Glycomyces albidus TaxID=2656774 RepID=UPI00128FFCB9|nr:hypothetical protein [Glycomyces albidus]